MEIKINEISRRCESHESFGMACGPMAMDVVIGEMVLEVNGETKYLTCEWISEAYDSLCFEITNVPIWDYFIDDESDVDELDEIRSADDSEMIDGNLVDEFDGPYQLQLEALRKIVIDKVKEEGFYLG